MPAGLPPVALTNQAGTIIGIPFGLIDFRDFRRGHAHNVDAKVSFLTWFGIRYKIWPPKLSERRASYQSAIIPVFKY